MPTARRTVPEMPTATASLDVIEALDPATRRKVIAFIAGLNHPQEAADAARSDWDLPSEPDVYVQHREQWL